MKSVLPKWLALAAAGVVAAAIALLALPWLTGGSYSLAPDAAVRGVSLAVSARAFGAVVFVGWLGLVVAYYAWAIQRYNVNHGLSDEEWKVLVPWAYAEGETELAQYLKRHEAMVAARQRLVADAAEAGAAAAPLPPPALAAPDKNPYKNDSFGLPPGTIRGTLALTAMVMFVVIELVSMFDPKAIPDTHFGELVTAFQMILAFYFGSRALDVLKARRERPAGKPAEKAADQAAGPAKQAEPAARDAEPTGEGAPAGKGEPQPQPQPQPRAEPQPTQPPASAAPLDPPAERAVIPAHLQLVRFASLETSAPAAAPAPAPGRLAPDDPIEKRALALTASFETSLPFPACFGAVSGDFDGQGLSFGALQWNIGSGTLQPLLARMREEHDDELRAALGALYPELCRLLALSRRPEQLEWARAIQLVADRDGKRVPRVLERWRTALRQLGTTRGMIALQVESALTRFEVARDRCQALGLWSDRALALLFDINVQNGALDRGGALRRIRDDFAALDPSLSREAAEVQRLRIVALRRSEVAGTRWQDDVRRRKLTIAEGKGVVHGRAYDLERDFCIGLGPPPAAAGGEAIAAAPEATPAREPIIPSLSPAAGVQGAAGVQIT